MPVLRDEEQQWIAPEATEFCVLGLGKLLIRKQEDLVLDQCIDEQQSGFAIEQTCRVELFYDSTEWSR